MPEHLVVRRAERLWDHNRLWWIGRSAAGLGPGLDGQENGRHGRR